VQEGCDKFCTFCVVPYTRGAEVSRPVEKILDEVRNLGEAGVREVTLIGQNVNAYHGQGSDGATWTLGRLLERLADVPGIARLRYTTSHPCDMDASLIAAHRDLPSLMPYLHLPVQSGCDRVLKRMNRRHTRVAYVKTVARLRAAQPELASDVLAAIDRPSAIDAAQLTSIVAAADAPALATAATLMDGAGQTVARWVAEYWRGWDGLYPFSADRYEQFGPSPEPGERLRCVALVKDEGHVAIADVEFQRPDGTVLFCYRDFRQRRFPMTAEVAACIRVYDAEYAFTRSFIEPGSARRVNSARSSAALRERVKPIARTSSSTSRTRTVAA